MTARPLAVLLAAALASPCAAAPAATADLSLSTASFRTPRKKPSFFWSAAGSGNIPLQRPSIGVGAGMKEGAPLEVMLWGGSGAVAGTVLGPGGTLVGAGLGLLYSVFVVPHNGPAPK